METEEAIKPVVESKPEVPSLEDTQDVIGKLIDESRPEEHTNGTKEAGTEKISEGKEVEKSNDPRSEESKQDEPSDRVKEGQRYNNRNRGGQGNRGDRGGRGGRGRGHDRGYQDRPSRRNNIKSDLTSQQESSDPIAIRKQVEFYFSDSNLLQDKFLFTKIEGHKNVPVPISVIHSFKRMRHFQPVSAIVDALKESSTLDIVDDDTSIQRKEPLPEGLEGKPMVEIEKVYEDKSMARSVYAKGFGEEQPSTQFDIEAFFAEYGPTNSVRLRRSFDATFKGSVFVEFDSEQTQKDFLSLAPTPKWQGNELQIKSKKQYCDEKVEDIAAGKVRPNEDGYPHRSNRDRDDRKKSRDSPDYDRGKKDEKDDRDWRVRRDEDSKFGFKDHRNGGKHKDSRGSGRGRDGGRGRGRGGRDRNDEAERQRKEHEIPIVRASTPDADDTIPATDTKIETPAEDTGEKKIDTPAQVTTEKNSEKEIDTAMGPPPTPDAEKESSSKKRAREENDDGTEEQGSVKKLDTKGGES